MRISEIYIYQVCKSVSFGVMKNNIYDSSEVEKSAHFIKLYDEPTSF